MISFPNQLFEGVVSTDVIRKACARFPGFVLRAVTPFCREKSGVAGKNPGVAGKNPGVAGKNPRSRAGRAGVWRWLVRGLPGRAGRAEGWDGRSKFQKKIEISNG